MTTTLTVPGTWVDLCGFCTVGVQTIVSAAVTRPPGLDLTAMTWLNAAGEPGATAAGAALAVVGATGNRPPVGAGSAKGRCGNEFV